MLVGELLLSKSCHSSDPACEGILVNITGGQSQHRAFLVVDASDDFVTIEQQGHFHGGVADSLVPVHEGMSLNECEGKGRGL